MVLDALDGAPTLVALDGGRRVLDEEGGLVFDFEVFSFSNSPSVSFVVDWPRFRFEPLDVGAATDCGSTDARVREDLRGGIEVLTGVSQPRRDQ